MPVYILYLAAGDTALLSLAVKLLFLLGPNRQFIGHMLIT